MIQQFKSLSFLNVFLLLILVYVLRIGLFLDLPEAINTGFSELGMRLLLEDTNSSIISPLTNIFLAGLIVIIQALIFNRLVSEYNILSKPTFIPALLFVV